MTRWGQSGEKRPMMLVRPSLRAPRNASSASEDTEAAGDRVRNEPVGDGLLPDVERPLTAVLGPLEDVLHREQAAGSDVAGPPLSVSHPALILLRARPQ